MERIKIKKQTKSLFCRGCRDENIELSLRFRKRTGVSDCLFVSTLLKYNA